MQCIQTHPTLSPLNLPVDKPTNARHTEPLNIRSLPPACIQRLRDVMCPVAVVHVCGHQARGQQCSTMASNRLPPVHKLPGKAVQQVLLPNVGCACTWPVDCSSSGAARCSIHVYFYDIFDKNATYRGSFSLCLYRLKPVCGCDDAQEAGLMPDIPNYLETLPHNFPMSG